MVLEELDKFFDGESGLFDDTADCSFFQITGMNRHGYAEIALFKYLMASLLPVFFESRFLKCPDNVQAFKRRQFAHKGLRPRQ